VTLHAETEETIPAVYRDKVVDIRLVRPTIALLPYRLHEREQASPADPDLASYPFRCAVQYPEQRPPAAWPLQIPRPTLRVSLPDPDAYLSWTVTDA
jgi:hypothetical protein